MVSQHNTVFDDGIDRPLHIAAEVSEHWYHTDLVGSVRLLTDTNGDSPADYRYAAFGKVIDSVVPVIFNPWRYTGRRFDVELKTYDYRARQYDPKVGRFVQRDPGGMVDQTNLYGYTINNPLSGSDPSGYGRNEIYHPPAMDFSVVDFSIVTDPLLRTASIADTALDVLGAIDSRAELKIGAALFTRYTWGNIAKFQSANLVNPSSSLGPFLHHPFIKGLGTTLSSLGFGLNAYNFYKDPNVESGVDLGFSTASLYSTFATGPTALVAGAGAAGYGVGKLGNWAVKKTFGVNSSDIGGALAPKK